MKLKLHNSKTSKLFMTAALVACTTFSFAQTQTWTGTTSTDFLDATNWDNSTLPGGSDDALINTSSNNPILAASLSSVGGDSENAIKHLIVADGATVTIAATLKIWANNGNYFGSGIINIEDGAVIDVRNQARFGNTSGILQTVNINGGSFNCKNQLIIGDNGDCTFNINGGLVTSTGNGIILGGYNGVGIVNITGGVMRLNGGLAIDDKADRPGSGYMTISGSGTLELVGDQTEAVAPYITANKIRTANGSLQAIYDSGTGNTTVSVDPATLSINNVSFLKDVKISPNPTSGAFTVNLPVALQNITTEIYSINGALVTTQNHNDNQTQLNINISDLASGVYVLKVLSNEGPMSFKLIKQ